MAASTAGVWNAQEFTSLGALGIGLRLYTYINGTTTQKTAYTDKAAAVPHTYTSDGVGGQYIALNARGELPAPLYLTTGSYDFVLKDAAGATIWTRRADPVADAVGSTAFSITADTSAYVQILSTSAGYMGLKLLDQTSTRKAEFIAFGSTNAGSYGIAAGMAGINTPVGVDFSIGVADARVMYFNSANSLVGIGVQPTAAQGALQLAGASTGGIKLGNTDNSYQFALDYYDGKSATSLWTPVLKFGGGVVGITYGTQTGRYTRIGNMVFVRLRIVLTSKGSSTGTATITGLPFTPSAVSASISELIEGEFGLMTALAASTRYGLSGTAGSAVLTVVTYDLTGASSAPISGTNAAFGNGSLIDLAFSYQCA